MKIAQTIADARADRAALGSLALVPTLGALHAGHLELIRAAKAAGGKVAVSIFLNPTQFASRDELANHPRSIERDLELCERAGVDLVFNPIPDELYPAPNFPLRLEYPTLGEPLEGRSRPHHFSGLAQVTIKLLNILTPQLAFYSQKDFQALRILQELVRDLNFPVEVRSLPPARDADGLALASTNIHLTREERPRALALYKALFTAQADLQKGHRSAARLTTTMQRLLLEQHLLIDYIAIVNPETMKDTDTLSPDTPAIAAIAVRLGKTRLTDALTLIP